MNFKSSNLGKTRGGHSRGYPIDLLIDVLYGHGGTNVLVKVFKKNSFEN
jgi:hypothetical protein